MLCLSCFELYSRWVPLTFALKTSILTSVKVVGSFTLHLPTLVKMNKTMKSGTLPSEVASRMK